MEKGKGVGNDDGAVILPDEWSGWLVDDGVEEAMFALRLVRFPMFVNAMVW